MNQPNKSCYSFGEFCLDGAERRLLRNGAVISLAPKVFDTLLLLVKNSGHLVEKDEFMRQIWAATFVGEDALARNISILRKALGGSSDSQTYIETIPKRGYRFVAEAQKQDDQERPAAAKANFLAGESSMQAEASSHSPSIELDSAHPSLPSRLKGHAPSHQAEANHGSPWRRRIAYAAFALTAGSLAGLVTFFLLAPAPAPRVTSIVQLSHSARFDPWGKIITDGSRLFYLQRDGDHWNSMQMPVSGGESQPFPVPFRNTRILDISPDKTEFLIAPFIQRSTNLPLWTMPVVGGTPRRLGSVIGDEAVFSPDGARIAYLAQDEIYVCKRTGSDCRKVASLPKDKLDLGWSLDGKVLRFRTQDPKTFVSSLWEVSPDGQELHSVLPGWSEWGGIWSPDGRYYFFLSCPEDACSIWALREKRRFPYVSKPAQPVRLTQDTTGFSFITTSIDGRRLYAATRRVQPELLQQDQSSKQFLTWLNGVEVNAVEYSRNGERIAWVGSNGHLSQSRPDGTNRVQLSAEFSEISQPRWSPDDTRIVFDAQKRGKILNIYEVRAEGGAVEELLPEDVVHVYPDWAPDGRSIAYSTRVDKSVAPPADGAIYVLDLQTRQRTRIPGSDALQYPRWSPDGKYLAALSENWEKAMLFDFHSRRWKEIAHGHLLSSLTWSKDGKYLYFEDILEPKEPVYRMRPRDSRIERWADFDPLLRSGIDRCQFFGLTPDGSVMVIASRGSSEIYALDLELP